MGDIRKAAEQVVEAWSQPNGINYVDFKPYMDNLRAELEKKEPISGTTEAVTRTVIEIEKLLCEKLGKQWRPSGMSIQTLVDEFPAPAQQEQEPVAWMVTDKDGRHFIFRINKPEISEGETLAPLYTHPPRREQEPK